MTAIDISPYLEAKSDHIVADDLIAGPRSFRILRVEATGDERPISIHLEGLEGKPFKPCKGMRRLLAGLWGRDGAQWAGRTLTLFRDPDVRFGADLQGGVRIAALSHIEAPSLVPVRVSRGRTKGYKVEPLAASPAADPARKWASAYISGVNAAADAEALGAHANAKALRLAELEAKRPDLHAECIGALAARRAELVGSTPEEQSDDWGDAEQEGTET